MPKDSIIGESELALNADGSIYHLSLFPENIADKIIICGDPGRAETIASFFDRVDFSQQNREFFTYSGSFNGTGITALSTGIGTDNIDIVINELDALVNIDLKNRRILKDHRSLEIVRLGTCGALHEDVPVDSFIASQYALGMDGLMNYYSMNYSDIEIEIREEFISQSNYPDEWAKPYIVQSDESLLKRLAADMTCGITATAIGFYGPQGRELRLTNNYPDLNEKLNQFEYKGLRILNYEMESSALFGLSNALGHKAATICTVVANRLRKEKSKNAKKSVELMIKQVLERLTA